MVEPGVYLGGRGSNSVKGASAALWNLLWLAVILALYCMMHRVSLQMTSFAGDFGQLSLGAACVSANLASFCCPGCFLEDRPLLAQSDMSAWMAQYRRPMLPCMVKLSRCSMVKASIGPAFGF